MLSTRPFSMLAIAAALALGLAGCGSSEPEKPSAPASTPSATEDTAPKVSAKAAGGEELSTTDRAGLKITLTTPIPSATATGVPEAIGKKFVQAVRDDYVERVDEQLQKYADLELAECDGTLLDGADSCARDAELTIEHAGVYEEYGTVASRSAFVLGSRDRNVQVHAVTMNLATGTTAELGDFLDLTDPADQDRAAHALSAAEHWELCLSSIADETTVSYLQKVEAFSPTPEGLLLLWAPNPSETAQCQVASATVPWATEASESAEPEAATEAQEEAPAEAAAPAVPVAEDVNGYWCPTPESHDTYGCVNISLPNAQYDSGMAMQMDLVQEAEGGFSFTVPGAPFGTYLPAGVPVALPDYYPGTDLPDQDRIWNGQTGTMLVRQ